MQALIVVSFSANIWRKRVSSGGERDGIHEQKWLVGHLAVAAQPAVALDRLRPLHMQCQVHKGNRRPFASTRWAVCHFFFDEPSFSRSSGTGIISCLRGDYGLRNQGRKGAIGKEKWQFVLPTEMLLFA
jgi:hypothetical protein